MASFYFINWLKSILVCSHQSSFVFHSTVSSNQPLNLKTNYITSGWDIEPENLQNKILMYFGFLHSVDINSPCGLVLHFAFLKHGWRPCPELTAFAMLNDLVAFVTFFVSLNAALLKDPLPGHPESDGNSGKPVPTHFLRRLVTGRVHWEIQQSPAWGSTQWCQCQFVRYKKIFFYLRLCSCVEMSFNVVSNLAADSVVSFLSCMFDRPHSCQEGFWCQAAFLWPARPVQSWRRREAASNGKLQVQQKHGYGH